MVELIMVVAVIMILSSIAFYGVSNLLRHARTQASATALEQCRGMLSTFETETTVNGGQGLALLNGTSDIVNAWTDCKAAPSGSFAPGVANLSDPAIMRTEAVMAAIANLPNVHAMFVAIPANKFLKNSSGGQMHVLVDGWGAPIIFVPGGGLSGVTTGGASGTIVAPTGHPFFASGGDDSNFSTGDDNSYSFRN